VRSCGREKLLGKYRRIEVNAYRRRVTVVSGEWRPGEVFDEPPAETKDVVSVNDTELCEPVEPDSPEGQLILVDAVRSLEGRLSLEARTTIWADRNALIHNGANPNVLFLTLRSVYDVIPRVLRFIRKEKRKDAAK
jgi:hypothetical protein